MPIMDGIQATNIIRMKEKYKSKHIPIIACTAGVTDGEMESIRLAGIDDCISKPIKKQELFHTLIRWVKN